MQPLRQQNWILPEESTAVDFPAALSKSRRLKTGPGKRTTRCWFDTFDWRLYRKKMLLCREGSTWILQDFSGRILQTLSCRRRVIRFAWEFPDSSLREALQGPMDVRALLEIGREEVECRELKILNRDKKIVVFLDLYRSTVAAGASRIVSVRLREVRGYAGKFKQLAGFIRKAGGRELAGPVETFEMVVRAAGRHPLDYSSGYDVPLEPEMSARAALCTIYTALLGAVRRNEQGVIEDIDSEFLHDLRVAVRRTRSGLALIKGVLAPEISTRFKKEFRLIGSMTGPVRDLDVYLLSEDAYRARLPERLQEGLGYFFNDLAAQRRRERKKLAHFLHSDVYGRILTDWEMVLQGEGEEEWGGNSEIPIGVLAGRIVHKRFRRVLRDGKKIHPQTPDSELHRLRIECKKLRYSLEFFASLHDRQQMKELIGQLKKLQNNLGDFNDLSVQQEMLSGYLSQLRPSGRKNLECAASIGGLMTDLARQHRQVRSAFEKTFARFSCSRNIDLYHSIFG